MKQNERDVSLIRLGNDGMTSEAWEALQKISRLAKKHNRICEMYCNGKGYLKGKVYTLGTPEGQEVSGYVEGTEEANVFYQELEKIESKIKGIMPISTFHMVGDDYKEWENTYEVKFQHDPRGYTVKVFYNDREISDLLY
jgi:hypothetical protein